MNGSKSFREKFQEAGLDLVPVDELIRRDFSSGSSNRVTSVPSVRDGFGKVVAEVEEPTAKEKVSPSQAIVPDGIPEKSSCKGSS